MFNSYYISGRPIASRALLEKLGWRKFLIRYLAIPFAAVCLGIIIWILAASYLYNFSLLLIFAFLIGFIIAIVSFCVIFQTFLFIVVRKVEELSNR